MVEQAVLLFSVAAEIGIVLLFAAQFSPADCKGTTASLFSLMTLCISMRMQCRAVKKRLTAYNGKLVTVEELIGDTSNGTGFNITLQAAPELDYTSLAVGEVVEGLPILQNIAKLPAVRSQSNSAFFKCGHPALKFCKKRGCDAQQQPASMPACLPASIVPCSV